jgi:hypothetical protein
MGSETDFEGAAAPYGECVHAGVGCPVAALVVGRVRVSRALTVVNNVM